MSEADKMFEELGLKKKYDINGEKEEIIMIGYDSKEVDAEECLIIFFVKIKEIAINRILNMQELKAINKKCEELGWL